jgi:hypothetical protein
MTPQQSVLFLCRVNSELGHSTREFRDAGIAMVSRGFVLPPFGRGADDGYRCAFTVRGTPVTLKVTFDANNTPTYTATTADGRHTVTKVDCRPSEVVLELAKEIK